MWPGKLGERLAPKERGKTVLVCALWNRFLEEVVFELILILVRPKRTGKGIPGSVTSRNRGTEVSEGLLSSRQPGKAGVHCILSVQ